MANLLQTAMFGAMGAALIAGIFSLVNMIISKEVKISELRQNWIDKLREDLSIFLSEIETLSRFAESALAFKPTIGFTNDELAEFRRQYRDHYSRLSETHRKIILRLNPSEHADILSKLKSIQSRFYGNCSNIQDIYKIIDDTAAGAQAILKSEWKRVKKGETIFRTTKIVFGVALILLFAIGFIRLFIYLFVT